MSDGFTRIGGEFAARERELAFRAAHFVETFRHAQLLFALSAFLNTLFLLSDWRFAGTPHFWVAVPARVFVVLLALLCLLRMRRADDIRAVESTLVSWMTFTALGVMLLVTSQSSIALLVVLMLPAIYYLAVPAAFRWTLAGGVGCSVLMLAGFMLPDPPPTALGLGLAVLMMNCALVIVVSRTNRLRRLEWTASIELERQRETTEKMFMAVPIPLLMTRRSDGRLIMTNDAGAAAFGKDLDRATGDGIADFYVDPSARGSLLAAIDRDGRIRDFETRARRSDGEEREVLINADAIEIAGEACILAGVVDITSRKALEAHLEQLATTDALTRLPNRTRFFAAAEAEIRRAARNGRLPALLMVDLDHFKHVNDIYGHEIGDLALKAFADLATATIRDSDMVARLGGEEFAILLPETGPAQAEALAERLRTSVEQLRISAGGPRLTVSIGVATVLGGEAGPDPALSRADRALYAAKRNGRNRVEAAAYLTADPQRAEA